MHDNNWGVVAARGSTNACPWGPYLCNLSAHHLVGPTVGSPKDRSGGLTQGEELALFINVNHALPSACCPADIALMWDKLGLFLHLQGLLHQPLLLGNSLVLR